MTPPTSTGTATRWRVRPAVGVAAVVFVVYVVVFTGLTSTSGVPYDDWFVSGPNAWRSAVLPLAAASLVLVAFLAWARWDHVFRDPERLWKSRALKVPLVVFGVGIILHLVFVEWGSVSLGLLLPVLLAGLLVGFAEETMFRGVILRALRSRRRSEGMVMVVSSLWFGLFHFTNLANGSPLPTTVAQVAGVTLTGVVLYLFRRWSGSLVPAMVAHGVWDVSVFLPTTAVGLNVVGAVQVVLTVVAVVAAVVLLRNGDTPPRSRGTR